MGFELRDERAHRRAVHPKRGSRPFSEFGKIEFKCLFAGRAKHPDSCALYNLR
jgi:hypothetical protein